MANEDTTNTQTETTAANTVVVPVPEPGQALTVSVEAEQIPQLNFDPGTESTQEFVGTDLVFTLDNGAVLTFEDFAASINDGAVTSIMLEDGSIIPIDALIAAWNLEVPETAAGSAPQGGGGSSYGDDMGDALGGIDKLGVQDPDPFGNETPVVQEDEQVPPDVPEVAPEAAPEFVISVSDTASTISEEGGEGGEIDTFTISLSTPVDVGNVITVDVAFGGSSEDADFYQAAQEALQDAAAATAGVDFDGTTLTFTDAFVGTELSFDVQALDDDETDSPEDLTVTLSNATAANGTATADDVEDVTITDVDQDISIAISDTQQSINEEGQESDTFTISLSEAINDGNVVTVKVGFTVDSDTQDADFTTPPPEATKSASNLPDGVSFDKATGILTFTDDFDGTELDFTVQAFDDDDVEGPETLTITLSDATAVNGTATITQATEDVTVLSQDQDITITIADTQSSISEEGGETDAFTISLSEAMNTGNTVTVDVDFATGTDTEDADFIIAAETALQAAADATAGVSYSSGTLTYTDAFVGTDLSFSVTAFDDDLTDSPETLNVTLGNATAVNGTAVASDSENVQVTDTDQDITITIADTQSSISEEGGETDAFTISLSEAMNTGNTVTVDVDFATGTDTEDADFIIAAETALQAAADATAGVSYSSGTLTYTDAFVGTDLSFSVTAFDDDLTDSPETLNVTLGNATAVNGTAVASDSENVQVTDTDQDITITIADTQSSISEEGGETDAFTISLSEAMNTGNTVTVDVDFATGTDTEDADFIIAAETALQAAADATAGVSYSSGTLTYTDAFVGTDLSFSVTAFDDDLTDSPETLNVTLGNATAVNGTAVASDSENVQVTDTDQDITITIADTQSSISEEGGETDAFTISLSEAMNTGNTVTVDVDFATGTDTEDADFIIAAETALQAAADATAGVSYSSGTLTYTDAFVGTDLSFSVTAFDDDLTDSPETLNVTLGNATAVNGTAVASDSENVQVTDTDQDITITIADTQSSISEEGGETDAFTISLSEAMNTGNTVTVDVDFATGTDTEDADFIIAAETALQAAADATAGVSYSSGTLTYTDAFVGTDLSFSVTAFDDDLTDSPETLNVTLGNATAVNGTAVASDSENVQVTDTDQDITITIADTQSSISEEGGETDAFTISLSEAMNTGNTVTVDVDFATGTDTEDADFIIAAETALQAAADATAGVSYSSGTLTYTDAFVGTDLSFSVTAFDDDLTDSPETLNVTLGNATAVNGTAVASDSENVQVTDTDQDITITIADTQSSISEEGGETDAFTISLSEAMNTGNTVTVDVDFATGTDTEDADFIIAAETALQAAADATAGVSYSSGTLTYTDAFVGTDLSFSVTAFDDDLTDSPETLNVTLGNATAVNGTAVASDSENVQVTDTDQDITITIADTQSSISEEGGETDAFTISLSEAMNTGNTVTVDVDFATGTDTEDADFIIAAETALQAAADATAGVSYSSGTLTYTDAFVGTDLSFSVTAFDDDLTDSPETLNVTLGNATAVNGTAVASDSENVQVTDTDQDITFAISVTSEDTVDDTATQQATVKEDNAADDLATYSIAMSETLNSGNTATVDITFSGSTDDADFTAAALTSLGTAVAGITGVSLTGSTLSYDSTYDGTPIQFTVEAFDDDVIEGSEDLVASLSSEWVDFGSANLVTGQEAATVDVLDAAVVFPTGLAYTVAGNKSAPSDGQFLYTVDLETGQTVLVGNVAPAGHPALNAVTDLALNPVDGYLYGVFTDGGTRGVIKVDPATAESEIIYTDNLFNSNESGATFALNGTMYIAIEDEIYTFDVNNPGAPSSIGITGVSGDIDGLALSPDDQGTLYIISNGDLYSVSAAGGAASGPFNLLNELGEDLGVNLDGLSFDDNGGLWADDNQGQIFSIDTITNTATLVSTVANSDVTGSGVQSLAISVVDPGSYVVLTDGIDTDTTYLPDDGVARDIDPEADGWDLPAPGTTNVDIMSNGDGVVSVSQDGATEVGSVYVQSDNAANIAVSNFDDVEIQTRGEGASTITVNDALTGMIDSGEGDDVISVNTGAFTINADGGDDTINLGSGIETVAFSATAGEGVDTINNFNVGDGGDTGGDILKFTDLLDDGDDVIDAGERLAFTDSVQVLNDGNDITLTVPDQSGGGEDSTVITLAGIGGDYAGFAGGTLTDFIAQTDINGDSINVDTYAS